MENREKYNQSFREAFSLPEDAIDENLEYNSIPEWDSIGHMELMASLEEVFDTTLEMDDIIDFSSYTKGIEILKKYKISV